MLIYSIFLVIIFIVEDAKFDSGRRKVGSVSEFPYIARIIDNRTDKHLCAATLINEKTLFTAGHCITYAKNSSLTLHDHTFFKVIAGVAVTSEKDNNYIERFVEKWDVHSEFYLTAIDKIPRSDLGVVRVKKPFVFNEFVMAAPLFSTDIHTMDAQYNALVNTKVICLIGGWGWTTKAWDQSKLKFGHTKGTENLHILDVYVMAISGCKKAFCRASDYICRSFPLENMQEVCVINVAPSVGQTFPDDGSPLICNKTLWGIGSWTALGWSELPHVLASHDVLLEFYEEKGGGSGSGSGGFCFMPEKGVHVVFTIILSINNFEK